MMKPDRVAASEPTRPVQPRLDAVSRSCIRSFLTCVLLLAAFNLPALLLSSLQPAQTLSRMKLVFGVMTWVAMIFAVQQRHRPLGPSLNLWDEAMAFLALALACSVALGIIG